MVTVAGTNAFADLRKLADWFGSLESGAQTLSVDRLVRRLGAMAIPLLGRELLNGSPRRRDASIAALASIAFSGAATERDRVVAELRTIATAATSDEPKLHALGLLAELGVKGTARLGDPDAMQRRSAHELALRLDSPAEVASAAELMIKQLSPDELIQLLTVMTESTPAAARRLACELAVRLDLDSELRDRCVAIVDHVDPAPHAPASQRPTHVTVLVDAYARLALIASRKLGGEKKWRRWTVLIGTAGRIEDAMYEADARDGDTQPLIDNLCADGYRIASTDLERARTVMLAAARITPALPSAYYLGRDLLDLADAHLGHRAVATSNALARAVELLASNEHARAEALLARCDESLPDVAAALGSCALATNRPAIAAEHFARAIAAEPAWPLHHWNLACALHQTADGAGCLVALRRFVSASATPSGLYADPDQPGRVACAERLIAELARTAKLKRRPRRSSKKKLTS